MFAADAASAASPRDRRAWRASAIDRALRTRAAWWSIAAALGVVLILPLFLVDIPPLTDYPNHLAREYVLTHGAHDPILSRIYAVRWGIIPNLAIDVVMPALARLLPLYMAGKIVLGVTLLLPVAGVAAYHRAVFNTRSLWPLASGLVAYNGLFLLGFMNFQISLGMALLGAASWVAWRDRHPVRLAGMGALWACAIFFAHVFGLLFLAVLVGGWEMSWLLRQHRAGGPVGPRIMRSAACVTAVFAPPSVLCLLAPIAGRGGPMMWRPLADRVLLLLLPFFSYTPAGGVMLGALFLLLLYVLARNSLIRLAPGAGWTIGALLAAYLVCPAYANGTAFIDTRLPVMLGFTVFAVTRPARLSSGWRLATGLLLALGFAARMTTIGAVWYDHNQDLTELRQAIAPVPAGNRVLAVAVYQRDNPAYWSAMPRGRRIPWLFATFIHTPALLVTEHRAFWPLLFTARGKQPLTLRSPYDRLGGHQGVPPDYHVLQHPIDAAEQAQAPYLAHWRRDFEYVLVLNAGGATHLRQYLPGRLHMLTRRDAAALFRIRR